MLRNRHLKRFLTFDGTIVDAAEIDGKHYPKALVKFHDGSTEEFVDKKLSIENFFVSYALLLASDDNSLNTCFSPTIGEQVENTIKLYKSGTLQCKVIYNIKRNYFRIEICK